MDLKKYMTFQGDVDIREIKEIPKSARLLDTKTIMYGEATGHHHTFQGQVLVYEPTENDTVTVRDGEKVPIQKYVQVLENAQLTHQEHKQQVIPAKTFAILQEREFDPLEQQIRRVMD
jgi:hypothetical protein